LNGIEQDYRVGYPPTSDHVLLPAFMIYNGQDHGIPLEPPRHRSPSFIDFSLYLYDTHEINHPFFVVAGGIGAAFNIRDTLFNASMTRFVVMSKLLLSDL